MKIFNIEVTFDEKEYPDDDDIKMVLETLCDCITCDVKGITVKIEKKNEINIDNLLKKLKEEMKGSLNEDQFGYAKQKAIDVYRNVIKKLEGIGGK